MRASIIALALLSVVAMPRPTFSAPAVEPTLVQGKGLPDGARIGAVDGASGLPTLLWAAPERSAASPRARHLDAVAAAREVLTRHADLYRLSPRRLQGVRAVPRFGAPGEGVVVELRSDDLGHPIWGERLSVVLDAELRAVAISGHLSPLAEMAPAPFVLTPELAWQADGNDLALHHEGLPLEARASSVYYPRGDHLEPTWVFELGAERRLISAVDGALLHADQLSWAHTYGYRVYTDAYDDDAPADDPSGGSYLPHPTGRLESLDDGATTMGVTYRDHAGVGPGDPWLPQEANELIGNAAAAYVDQAMPDGLDLYDIMPVQNGPSAFDYPHDAALDPRATAVQAAAAATQLFYAVNYFHDLWYAAGFDEAAGNAQADNFGRGGEGGDRLLAEVESRVDSSLARIVVPRDGGAPRLETFLTQGPSTVVALGWGAAPYARRWMAGPTDLGPGTFNVDAELTLANDGGPQPEQGCAAPADPSGYAGKLVVVFDGGCSIAEKVHPAQAAGAVGVIVVASGATWSPPRYLGPAPGVVVPVVSLVPSEGGVLLEALQQGELVGVSLSSRGPERRDVAFDRTVVDHELGHYLVSRLVVEGGLSNVQGRALAEGYADFVALLGAVRPADVQAEDFGGLYPVGGYAGFDRYFGVRRVPYSVDVSRDPLTFGWLAPGREWAPYVPHREVGDVVHQAGEVWASALWEGAVALFRDRPRLDFETARRRLRSYLVRSLTILPPQPTFIEARDALLAVALANDPRDYTTLSLAFGRRGFGQGAVAPERSATSLHAVIESFDADRAWTLVSASFEDTPGYCDRDGILDDGESGTLVLVLKNSGVDLLDQSEVTVSSDVGGLYFPSPRQVVAPTQPWRSATVRVPASLAGERGRTKVTVQLELYDPNLPELQHLEMVVPINRDPRPSTTEDFESPSTPFAAGRDLSLPWVPGWSRVLDEDGNRAYFAATPDRASDQYLTSPPLFVRKGDHLAFSFAHRYALAPSGDGAVVEVSVDNGATWQDLGWALSPGYNGTVSSGPLQGRPAYVGFSRGLPARERVTADLGLGFGGRTVRVRFRHASDGALTWWGWELDELAFSGIIGTPFVSMAAEDHLCVNRPPVAVAPLMKIVPERAIVQFDLGLSHDPDGDPLTFQITQIQGPGAQLNPTSFVAPNVRTDTVVAFRMVAFDGQAASAPVELRYLVKNIDPPMQVRGPVQLGRPKLP